MQKITGLSLFSGVDVARMAASELGLDVEWYSSEIDKFAIKGAQALYDGTTYLGDMTKWDEWEEEKGFDFSKVDILFAGFPCQAWSLAGKQRGDDDPRGALVHDLLDIWSYIKTLNPNVKFMFENVSMKKEFMYFINKLFGCEPTMINSALLTAQNRKRNYWANWEISQPEDKGILLKDIVEGGTVDREKSLCITTRIAGATEKRYLEKSQHQMVIERPCELRDTLPTESALCHHVATATDIKANEANKRVYADTGKSPTVTTMGGGHREPKVLVGVVRATVQKHAEHTFDGKCPTLTAAMGTGGGNVPLMTDTETALKYKGKYIDGVERRQYRKLTPRECMRLQGFTEEIIEKLLNAGISNSQLYKMTGNSFTLPVIIHNLQCLLNTGWPENMHNQ